MDITQLTPYIEVVSGIVGIGTAIWTANKYVWKRVWRYIENLNKKFDKIDTIYKEVQPNGGGSLRDAVNCIKNNVGKLEKHQRASLSYDKHGVFETDEKGNCTWVNRSYLKILNATPEEVLGTGWKNFISPRVKESVFEEWYAAVNDKRDFKMNVVYINNGFKEVNTMVEAFSIKDEKGTLSGYVGYISNLENKLTSD